MNWDEKAEDYAGAHHTYEHLPAEENYPRLIMFRKGAKWQREQLRTKEAVERVARGLFARDMGDGPAAAKWDNVAEGIRQNYRADARAAITALTGEES
ncbi:MULTISPECIES: hypothetical protein [unclassified Brevibacterium]|uniref:hypothetical protein n=1 Tax=unclassified Brevibacterium TaxID=2614124 RepID=UPI001E6542A1|nr:MULTISPECIES: hypothetical protein [unclassified Brevibacterium]MCD1287320.1 hypothetical protein [Brevibacterium sp. CCUG 69071]MDK8436425.1 hypothetical protein [Brevibacterium sp. H-BE7]